MKLRDALDNNFEYLGHDLNMLGFQNAIKKYLKTEKSRLKTHFQLCGEDDCPSHVNPDQWDRLQDCWDTKKQVIKSTTMAHARRQVKKISSVGRKGKANKEVQMVSAIVLNHFTMNKSVLWSCFHSGVYSKSLPRKV